MEIGKIIKQKRVELGLTLEEVGNLVGVSKSTVKKWEDGFIANMKRDKIALLAKALKLNPVSLIVEDETEEDTNIFPLPQSNIYMRPIYDSVSAGFGVLAQDNVIGYMPTYITCPSEQELYIWVNVVGDSMSPLIDNGSKVLVKKQTSVDSGQFAVILIEGEEALVKKVIYGNNFIELQSVNPYYPPRRFIGSNVQKVQILGLVKEVSKTLQ